MLQTGEAAILTSNTMAEIKCNITEEEKMEWLTIIDTETDSGALYGALIKVKASLRWWNHSQDLGKQVKGVIELQRFGPTDLYRIKYEGSVVLDGGTPTGDHQQGTEGVLYLPSSAVGKTHREVLQSTNVRANAVKVEYPDNIDDLRLLQLIIPGRTHFADFSGLVFGEALERAVHKSAQKIGKGSS